MSKYAIDPELLPWLDMLPLFEVRDATSLAEVRAGLDQMRDKVTPYEPTHPIDIRDEVVPGPAGAPDVAVRIYRRADREGPQPALFYIHGGGFIMGGLEMADLYAIPIVDKLGIVVVAVDYRLAPETPFPGPVEDCYAALLWTAAKASELGIDPARLAIGGESAGGGLTAGTTLLARDRGGPALCYQYLWIPELDDRLATECMREYVDTPMWNYPNAVFSWDSYLGEGKRGTEDVSPYAAPARAADLAGLPPTVVTVCQFDPLRDEGLEYARRLSQANVPTELRGYAGSFHGSTLIGDAAVTQRAAADQLADLSRGLGI
ncbi:alpha/beta hydrolase [Kibdelosporangium philippinense]|uniref:Alpha/beta hydrolase n=2 Tax=Kibdelosporangium philippinense TaxID=211113 RepID=A0ABS8Z1I1_9PSEU|nr:alpha/beta hydrolase [Kibdelosporangium philippinense]MCE7001700.1 alpha/beta hydrolase [Kibdelosporangium philippinense]